MVSIENIINKNNEYIHLLNKFSASLSDGTLTFFDIQTFFKELGYYAAHQFVQIKQAIEEFKIDERQAKIHLKNQDLFIKELDYICSYINEDISKVKFLMNFLIYWTDLEILKQNSVLLKQIEFIKKGMDPSVAYETFKFIDDNQISFMQSINKFVNMLIKDNEELRIDKLKLENEIKNLQDNIAKANFASYPQMDNITNLPNRNQGVKAITSLLEDTQNSATLGIFLISLTNYNQIMERFGYEITNSIVLTLITIMDNLTRSDDVIYSMKRDEFMIICPNLNEPSAINIANLIFEEVDRNSVLNSILDDTQDIEINIGISLSNEESNTKSMLEKADLNLKESKALGANNFKI